jgi:hypothetical protein
VSAHSTLQGKGQTLTIEGLWFQKFLLHLKERTKKSGKGKGAKTVPCHTKPVLSTDWVVCRWTLAPCARLPMLVLQPSMPRSCRCSLLPSYGHSYGYCC